MNPEIQTILKDLYQYDPGLKQYEEQVTKTISYLLIVKPDILFDEAFAKRLRAELLAKASLMEKPKTFNFIYPVRPLLFIKRLLGIESNKNMPDSQTKPIMSNGVNKLTYVISGLMAVALIVFGVNYYKQPRIQTGEISLFDAGENITKLGNNAFGELALNDNGARPQSGGGGGFGAGGDGFSESAALNSKVTVPAMGIGGGGGGGVDMIVPPYYGYNYAYTGEDFSIDQDQMAVYRRTKAPLNSGSLNSLLSSLNFGLFDLGSFGPIKADSLTLTEDKDFGHMFYVNFTEGTISINENWQKWQTPDRLCRDEACYQSYRFSLNDIPEDSELIKIANQFLKEHNISTANYGEPIVINYWEEEYQRAADKTSVYIPDVVSVIYPGLIDGQEVYDESGNKTGLNVAINVRVNKVSGVYELRANSYEASKYNVETDTEALIEQAKKGGFNNWFFTESADAKTVELGTPQIALVKYYNYKNGQSEELYIPSLIFPITSMPEGEPYFWQKNVVIPLVKGLIERPEVMPLMDQSVVSEPAR